MPDGHPQDEPRDGAAHGGRQSSAEFEYQFRHHAQSLGERIGNAGRKLIGRLERLVRNPKNGTPSDDSINSQDAEQSGKNIGRS